MAQQAPSDTPYGLQPNIAAGLAYVFGLIGGIVIYLGGGTNRMVKWAAAQSITMWGLYIAISIVLRFAAGLVPGLWVLALPILGIIGLIWFILWLWTFITAFQGKEVDVPVIGGLTRSIFKDAASTPVP
jgi:uncharacterized membrane protein